MTNVLYIQPTAEVGGSDVALYRLISHLDKGRFRPLVALPQPGPLLPSLEEAGARVVVLPMAQLRHTLSPRYQAGYLLRFWPTVLRLTRLIREEQVALVHTNSLYSLYGAWAARLAGVPHLWHIREIPVAPGPVVAALRLMVERLSSGTIVMTQAVGALFSEDGRRPPSFRTIPDGIDLQEFHPGVSGERIRQELGLAPGTPLVGFVARLDPWKGLECFLRAAQQVALELPQAHFLVAGGPIPGYEGYAQAMKSLAGALGLNETVFFTDWRYAFKDIPEVMAALEVVVHCSLQPEPFGLILVEAMASARPVVAAHHGGVAEVIAEGSTGLLFPPGDASALAQGVLQLLRDPERARSLGQAGRKRAEELFRVEDYVAKVEAFYDDLLKTKAAQP